MIIEPFIAHSEVTNEIYIVCRAEVIGELNRLGRNAFKEMKIIPDNATNGDMIKDMFPNAIIKINEIGSMVHVKYNNHTCWVNYELEWWNAPYKRGDSDGSN